MKEVKVLKCSWNAKVKLEPSTFVSINNKKWSCFCIYLFIYKPAWFLLFEYLMIQRSTFLLEIEMSLYECCPDNVGVLVNVLIFGLLDWFRIFLETGNIRQMSCRIWELSDIDVYFYKTARQVRCWASE